MVKKQTLLKTLILLFIGLVVSISSIAKDEPVKKIKLGAYLTSLYDIDQEKGTFSADLWVWTLSNLKDKYKIKDQLEVNYLSSQYARPQPDYYYEVLEKKVAFEQKKIQGVFLHDFSLEKFPFDHQKLQIAFEDNTLNHQELNYIPDDATGFDSAISIDGWKIKSVTATHEEKKYNTNFGNYTRPPEVSYSRVVLNIDLERDAPMIFFKVTIGLFIAVFVAIGSCFMRTHSEDIFSGRMALLGGSLLAAVVNHQFADSKQGDTTTVTLIDSLHMTGMIIVMSLFVLTAISRALTEKYPDRRNSHRLDNIGFFVATIIFVTICAVLIIRAIKT